tara:strand:+ start:246 stop:494 length:249 start_codon:yes stop_codon:yes gene_type:complete
MSKVEKQKMSDKIFDQLMFKENQILDKTNDLIEALKLSEMYSKEQPRMIGSKLIDEIDNLLFERHELSCAHSKVDEIEREEK